MSAIPQQVSLDGSSMDPFTTCFKSMALCEPRKEFLQQKEKTHPCFVSQTL